MRNSTVPLPKSRRTTSGALISVEPDHVWKSGKDEALTRIIEQGRWLQANPAPCLPKVYEVIPELGYVMERLTSVPWALVDDTRVAVTMVTHLRDHVWSKPCDIVHNWDVYWSYLRMRAEEAGLDGDRGVMVKLRGRYINLRLDALPTQQIHGDPTFDNVMLRDGELVITDPIPANGRIPGTRAMDIGKMLQSKWGYEFMRGTSPRAFNWDVTDVYDAIDLTMDEEKAAVFFACGHLIRALRYQTPDMRRQLLNLLEEMA